MYVENEVPIEIAMQAVNGPGSAAETIADAEKSTVVKVARELAEEKV
jgi:hypothetical protein